MKLNIQTFAMGVFEVTQTKENIYYNDGTSIKQVKVTVTPVAISGIDFENDFDITNEDWQKSNDGNGSAYKIYTKNINEPVTLLLQNINDFNTKYVSEFNVSISEIVKKYEPTEWEDGVVVSEAYIDNDGIFHDKVVDGTTLITKERLNNIENGIKTLYEDGAASTDIYIGNVSDAPAEAKIVIDKPQILPLPYAQVSQTLEDSQEKAPSGSVIINELFKYQKKADFIKPTLSTSNNLNWNNLFTAYGTGISLTSVAFENLATAVGSPASAYGYGLLITICSNSSSNNRWDNAQIYISDFNYGIYYRARTSSNKWYKFTTTELNAVA